MGANKKQIISAIESRMSSNEIPISPFKVDGETVDRLGVDMSEVGLISNDGTWFFPLNELTVSELKTVKSNIK